MPWIATGVFVYQSFISNSKMWNIYTIPKGFMVYSVASIVTLFFSGFLVDKFTSRKLIPLMNLPLLFAMIVLFLFKHEITAFMVFSTAFGTAVFGILIDYGFSIENIALISGIYIVISLILLLLIRGTLEPIKLENN